MGFQTPLFFVRSIHSQIVIDDWRCWCIDETVRNEPIKKPHVLARLKVVLLSFAVRLLFFVKHLHLIFLLLSQRERERKNESFSFRHYAVSGACLFIFRSFFKGSWLHLIQSLALCSHTHTTLARNSMIILLQRFIVFGPCRKELANFSSSTVETPMADFGVVFTVLLLVRRRSSLVVHISFVPSSKAYGIDQK